MLAICTLLILGLPVTSAAISTPHALLATNSVASGPHFRITVHFEDAQIAKDALAAAEAAWPSAIELFGKLTISADKPLEIHLYRTIADYERVEDSLTHGAWKRNLSFTYDATGEAHIALQPDVCDAVLAKIGLPLMSRELIAHEASHVILDRAWPNHASLPLWLNEGAALWVSEQAMKKGGWIEAAMDDPMIATLATAVKRLEGAKQLPTLAAVFDEQLGALDPMDRYAVWMHVFHFLRDGKSSAALTRILDSARRQGGGSGHAAAVAKSARSALSASDDLSERDREFGAYVRALATRWDEVHRALWTRGDTWLQAAFTSSNAISWHTEDVGAARYEISGEVEIFEGPAQQLNLLLARTPNGFVQVSWVAGQGAVVFEYDNRRPEAEQWKKLGAGPLDNLPAGKSTPFKVSVAGSTVKVEIAGRSACEVDVGDHPMQGASGLGALAGSAGAWRKLQIKKK